MEKHTSGASPARKKSPYQCHLVGADNASFE